MSRRITIDPITRIEGHLRINAEVDNGKVTDAECCGEMYRGFENILRGRNPLDAQQLTQRICGVCSASHAQASCLNLDSAFDVVPPDNGRIIRNIVQGANYLQSHILHFYHLAALDFVDITAILSYHGNDKRLNNVKSWAKAELEIGEETAISPFLPRYKGDYITDVETNISAINNYLSALEIRRKAHEMLAIFGGKIPHEIAILPGGVTVKVTVDKISAFSSRIKKLQNFIDSTYIPDVLTIADNYPDYFTIGVGPCNLLSYGIFNEGEGRQSNLFPSGAYINGALHEFSVDKIAEFVKYSKYTSKDGKHPSMGETNPSIEKENAYSWIKTPRYDGNVMEVGPLARMAITHLKGANQEVSKHITKVLKRYNAPFEVLFSVLGRHAARAIECKIVADKCAEWVTQLKPGEPAHTKYTIPEKAKGMGLTEAPRGSLGHWIEIKDKKIDRYQCVVPTTWNASPKDSKDQKGAIEQALIGTPIADLDNPIEIGRVVRSFDPCIACSVHVLDSLSKKYC